MSFTSQLLKGQITLEQFVQKSAAELHKDAVFFVHLPWASTVVDFALSSLTVFLKSQGMSATLVVNIVGAIRTEYAALTAPVTANPTPPV
jgi:hypothetical protein